MSARLPAHALEEVAQKWRALAERRCAHFLELRRSGRWRHYYGESAIPWPLARSHPLERAMGRDRAAADGRSRSAGSPGRRWSPAHGGL